MKTQSEILAMTARARAEVLAAADLFLTGQQGDHTRAAQDFAAGAEMALNWVLGYTPDALPDDMFPVVEKTRAQQPEPTDAQIDESLDFLLADAPPIAMVTHEVLIDPPTPKRVLPFAGVPAGTPVAPRQKPFGVIKVTPQIDNDAEMAVIYDQPGSDPT